MNAEDRGVPLIHKLMRRVVVGACGIGCLILIPESIVIFPVREEYLLCIRVHRLQVEGTIVRDESLEALVVMTRQIVNAESSEAGTYGTQFVFIHVWQILCGIIDSCQIVFHALTSPVAADFLQPLLSESWQTTTVGGYYDIAVRSHNHEVPTVAPELGDRTLRTTFAEEQGGVFLCLVEVRWQNNPSEHVLAVRSLHPTLLYSGLSQLVEDMFVLLGQLCDG